MDELLPQSCDWCPRMCGADRRAGQAGVCGAGARLRVARAALHFWEEPPISGEDGSGAIFFSYCPLQCVYCQNAPIALGDAGADIDLDRLVAIMGELQAQGALNINLVTPTHYAFLCAEAVRRARGQGMDLPIVWNTGGYERAETLRAIAGTADIFLTDFKYAFPATAQAYSRAKDYPSVAMETLEEMVAQTGEAAFDTFRGQERMTRGVIVRHLLLPGHLEESCEVLRRVHGRFGGAVRWSLMNQYTPVLEPGCPAALDHPELLEPASNADYERLLDFADFLGIRDYYWQDGGAVEESFIPAFDLTGVLVAGQ